MFLTKFMFFSTDVVYIFDKHRNFLEYEGTVITKNYERRINWYSLKYMFL